MIVLPVGHEKDTVRRLPWVTFGIMALCAVVLYVTPATRPGDDERIFFRMEAAAEYFLTHPYLEVEEADLDLLFPGRDRRGLEIMLEAYRESYRPAGGADRRQEQQAELDRRIAMAREAVERLPVRRWGLVPAAAGPVTLLTHMFLHAGWLHLLSNLFILYLVGPFIEDVYGRVLFAGFYLASGVAGGLAHLVWHLGSTVPLVGASGAIAGAMGAFLIRYRNTDIHFVYLFGLSGSGTFSAPAWSMLPLWFAEQVAMGLLVSGEEGGVAYWAHAGGFAFGVAAALIIKNKKVEERYIRPRIDAKVDRPVMDAYESALVAVRLARDEGQPEQAAEPLLVAIREELRRGDHQQAVQHWRDLLLVAPVPQADPALLVRLARRLHQAGDTQAAAAALRLALLERGGKLTAPVALRLARLAREIAPDLAGAAARLALARPGLAEAERAGAEALLAEPVSSARPG